jgi:hypothetical protein
MPTAYCILLLVLPAGAVVDEPQAYRLDNFLSEVPATLKGATVVTTAEAERLWRSKAAVFVDVLPMPPKPANLAAGTIWREPLRRTSRD